MAESTLWWLATGGLVAVELLTGTFYLLLRFTGVIFGLTSLQLGEFRAL